MNSMWLLQAAADESVKHIWHFWLAVVLAIVTVPTVLGILALYVFKVTRSRYPDTSNNPYS